MVGQKIGIDAHMMAKSTSRQEMIRTCSDISTRLVAKQAITYLWIPPREVVAFDKVCAVLECAPKPKNSHQHDYRAHRKETCHRQYLLLPEPWSKELGEWDEEDDDIKEHVCACEEQQRHLCLVRCSVPKTIAYGLGLAVPKTGDW